MAKKKNRGYALPDQLTDNPTTCAKLDIPDTPEDRAAFRGALLKLGEWHNWERTGDDSGSQHAAEWLNLIYETLTLDECDPFGEDEMSRFELCWQNTEDGWKLVYSINAGCSYVDVKECGTSNVVYFPQPDSVVPPDPVDNEGDYPIPDVDPENRDLQRCKVVDGALKQFFTVWSDLFVNNVLDGNPAAAGNNIVVWLDTITEEDPDYLQYFNRWKAVYEKHYPNHVGIVNAWEPGAIWVELLECIVFDCLPADLNITREVMDCISDAIEAADYGSGEDTAAVLSFLVDFADSLPLSAVRNRVFRQANADFSPECGDCGEEPAPETCSSKLAFNWGNISVSDSAGWVPEIDGAPAAWAIDDADFSFVNQGTLMTRYGAGWKFTQNGNSPAGLPKLSGSIVYDWLDETYNLCDLFARVTTSTNSGNTRMATAWAESESGLWIPLVGKRLNIYKKGDVNLSWVGAPIAVKKVKLVGSVGGGEFRFNDITFNGQVVP